MAAFTYTNAAIYETAYMRPWEYLYTQLCDYDDIESENVNEIYEQLCELDDNPVDLNNATDDDLKRLVFLTKEQREGLTEYLDRYRPLRSIAEIAMIESMDPLRIEMLRRFSYIGDNEVKKKYPSLKTIAQYGKNEIIAMAKIPFYERKGDKNGYLGYKYKHWFRYKFAYGQYFQIGITGAQDAGEPFFASSSKWGYDHYGYYAIIRNMGNLKAAAIGQYKLRFGMGIAMNTGFSLGKTTSLVMAYPENTISPNTSRSEAYFLQGAAATIAFNKLTDVTLFGSTRKIDATLNDNGSIKSIIKTGYHRTVSEISRKHNATQSVMGGNVRLHDKGLHIGATAFYSVFNRDLQPDASQLFRLYYPTGNKFWNASIDYGFFRHKLSFNGETATSNSHGIATLNTLAWKVSSSLSITAIQRYYSYKYYSLFSNSFSDGGNVQNESGIYIGATWNGLPRLSILAYTDYAYHPWATYRASKATTSIDNLVQATYDLRPFIITARYRLRKRQEDTKAKNSAKTILGNKYEHRARLSMTYSTERLQLKTQADIANTSSLKTRSFGWMLMQTGEYSFPKVDLYANICYFHTHDYDSRIYAYERGTLYNFSFPMYYGKGMHGSINMRTSVIKNVLIIGKLATTKYFDREKISSSYQEIDGSMMTDAEIQIKWKF